MEEWRSRRQEMPLEKGPIGTCQRRDRQREQLIPRPRGRERTSARVRAGDGQQRVGGRADGQSQGPDQGTRHTGSRGGRQPPLTLLIYPRSGSLPHTLGLGPEFTSSWVLLGTELTYRSTENRKQPNTGLEHRHLSLNSGLASYQLWELQ